MLSLDPTITMFEQKHFVLGHNFLIFFLEDQKDLDFKIMDRIFLETWELFRKFVRLNLVISETPSRAFKQQYDVIFMFFFLIPCIVTIFSKVLFLKCAKFSFKNDKTSRMVPILSRKQLFEAINVLNIFQTFWALKPYVLLWIVLVKKVYIFL